uniref:Acrosin-binding protein n=1 Tax=Pogona vitticeps TaxID=103695 RepID=A0A6J0UNR3_9SAUR
MAPPTMRSLHSNSNSSCPCWPLKWGGMLVGSGVAWSEPGRMAGLRLTSPTWSLVVGFSVFLAQLIPKTLSVTPGSPLSEEEYDAFFSSLKPAWKASQVCQIRHNKGCSDPKIVKLDLLENHGQIPEGPICTGLPENIYFDTFCLFAQFRCLTQTFYTKRVVCPNPLPVEEIIISSPAPSKKPGPAPTEISLSPEIRLRSNVDAILKYAFAVSGEEPIPRIHFPSPDSNWGTLQSPTEHEHAEHLHVVVSTEEPTTDIKATEGLTDQKLHQSIHRLISKAFSLEQALNSKDLPDTKDIKIDLNYQETTAENSPNGSSIFALDNDGALVVLCYSVLQDICISSAVSKAWKQMEDKTLGFGDLVCDNFGRHHEDLCSQCAFCSLKTEQCAGAVNLKRVHCDNGTFTDYLNPGILAQHQAMVTKVSPDLTEFYGLKMYEGLQAKYWCDRLATHGCDDFRVALWLQSEYSLFHRGDFPDKICDSEKVQHPTYCSFKSSQCREYSLNKKKVMRIGCLKTGAYHVLSKEEGKDEVMLWKEKFLSFSEG